MTAPAGAPATLDCTRLEAIALLQIDGQPDVVAEMVTMFIDEATARLSDANAARATNDLTVLLRSAHSLRGACGVIGALRMGVLAAQLEAAIKAQGDIAPDMAALVEEFQRVRVLLHPYAPAAAATAPAAPLI